jgi:hypothetical protein
MMVVVNKVNKKSTGMGIETCAEHSNFTVWPFVKLPISGSQKPVPIPEFSGYFNRTVWPFGKLPIRCSQKLVVIKKSERTIELLETN